MTITLKDMSYPWVGPPFFAITPRGRSRVHVVRSIEERVGMAEALRAALPGQYEEAVDADFLSVGFLCGKGADFFRWVDCEAEGQFCDDCLLADMSPCVYRVFDILGRLLYVGSSEKPFRRIDQHRTKAAWWHLATDWTAEPHPSLESARRAETEAIASERPWFNLRGITAPIVTSEG